VIAARACGPTRPATTRTSDPPFIRSECRNRAGTRRPVPPSHFRADDARGTSASVRRRGLGSPFRSPGGICRSARGLTFWQAQDARHLVAVALGQFPDWHPWVLCGFRTGLRLGELLGLQWSDVDWCGSFVLVRRNIVPGQLTTPKNHQRRRVDLAQHLRAVLRLWRRQQRALWLQRRELPPA
jgi:integrase